MEKTKTDVVDVVNEYEPTSGVDVWEIIKETTNDLRNPKQVSAKIEEIVAIAQAGGQIVNTVFAIFEEIVKISQAVEGKLNGRQARGLLSADESITVSRIAGKFQ